MTQTLAGPIPAIGWDATDEDWLYARRFGLGGSDILAILGFSRYRTPWDVWAEKTGVRSWQDEGSDAADLGTDLEPWLETQATRILGVPVSKTAARTYQHADHAWRLCSPDGSAADGRLVEYKTAGLASGFGIPAGWADGAVPLGYEFQVRWSLHVMDRDVAEVVALIAGLGLVRRTVVRDIAIELDLVAQVADWHQRHIVHGEEPPFGAVDNPALARLYPTSNGQDVDLSGNPDALELWHAYRDARDRETRAAAEKKAAGAALKKLLGDNERALIDGRPIATWGQKKGSVDWPALVADLIDTHKLPAPDPEAYRKPPTRSLTVKDA
jgi:putative phage-type endonuclease